MSSSRRGTLETPQDRLQHGGAINLWGTRCGSRVTRFARASLQSSLTPERVDKMRLIVTDIACLRLTDYSARLTPEPSISFGMSLNLDLLSRVDNTVS